MYISIEGITLENFSVLHQSIPLLESYHVSRQSMFHFFSGYRKQYAATTASHSKRIIELLENRKICLAEIRNTW